MLIKGYKFAVIREVSSGDPLYSTVTPINNNVYLKFPAFLLHVPKPPGPACTPVLASILPSSHRASGDLRTLQIIPVLGLLNWESIPDLRFPLVPQPEADAQGARDNPIPYLLQSSLLWGLMTWATLPTECIPLPYSKKCWSQESTPASKSGRGEPNALVWRERQCYPECDYCAQGVLVLMTYENKIWKHNYLK